VIADDVFRDIELGEVSRHLFWNVASVGLSVALRDELTGMA
jgi:hypothetical protein